MNTLKTEHATYYIDYECWVSHDGIHRGNDSISFFEFIQRKDREQWAMEYREIVR